ncbi:MAG: 3-deoxy-D-manno-octulosonic acid transferase [Muribaculaceae bacterium]|nr:3-deoxy-D-manno-octulosonic acid transferase [Muribaculaceae bacterium]
MVKGQRRTFSHLCEHGAELRGCLWIHAASLGEFEQGRPLIERLRREHPEKKILLTFFSPSGYEVRKNYPQVDYVAYLPFDTPRNARRFLDAVRPSMAIFVKYEFWGNFLEQLAKRNIPTYIISAIFRPKQVFFKWYGREFRRILRSFTHLYLQDEASARLLKGIGMENTTVAGDTRFDRVTDILSSAAEVFAIERFGTDAKMRIVFGSSWGVDEEKYIPWLNEHPEVAAIIAPHEFNEQRLEQIEHSLKGKVMRLSQWEKAWRDGGEAADVKTLIVDSFGKLATLYRYGDAAYVGGGFGVGIHNINEAAVYGIPVIFGPNYAKFKEARDMVEIGAAITVSDGVALRQALTQMLTDPQLRREIGAKAGEYIKRNLGATDLIYSRLF